MSDAALTYNTRQVGHSDVNGRCDALEVCGQKRDGRYYLYMGHLWSGGASILDVTNPAAPEVV